MAVQEKEKPSRWPSQVFISLAVSFFGAILLHAYSCDTGTTDQCLMSKGLFPVYWGVGFIMSWPAVAMVAAVIRERKELKAKKFPE
jgi:hypothetical protein